VVSLTLSSGGKFDSEEIIRLLRECNASELNQENAELKKMYADAMLGNKVLKEMIEKSCKRGAPQRTRSSNGEWSEL